MADLIPLHSPHPYAARLLRTDGESGRTYLHEGRPLPSVTTILSATKDRGTLSDWESRVGADEALRIRTTSAELGTAMHLALEHFILGRPTPVPRTWNEVRGTWMGYRMADQVLRESLTQAWALEQPLCLPGRYAGTADCIGLWRDRPAILDFKQTDRPKRREWIEDYFLQVAAYAIAHDAQYGTQIDHGVILIMDQTGQAQTFHTAGREFAVFKDRWMWRLGRYEKEAPSAGDTSTADGAKALGFNEETTP